MKGYRNGDQHWVLATRALVAFVFCADIACLFGSGTQPAIADKRTSLSSGASERVFRRTLTFTDRVAFQRAIEEVYWRHRIWPKENSAPKPSLDLVISRAELEKKVRDYLRKSQALEDYWQHPITAEQLQAEMDRITKHTQQPEVLRELFEALGNDPFVIAECLARPALAERLLSSWYARDQRIHGELRQRAEADLRAHNTVEQMKRTSGKYSEIEMVRSEKGQAENDNGALNSMKLNGREWDKLVQKLDVMFKDDTVVPARKASRAAKGAPITQVRTGVLSPLQEDATSYYATAVIEKTEDRLKLATITWPKEPLESWLVRAESQNANSMVATRIGYTLPAILGVTCSDNTWTNTYNGPEARLWHTVVWTGSEMIIWGGRTGGVDTSTGWRYSPSTDTWAPTSMINAASLRSMHTAVWTGSEMVVWGGSQGSTRLNTGGKYNPSTDSWVATTNLPSPRSSHTAVWTGSEMIVWGGTVNGNYLNTGGRYNPSSNSWTATSTSNAPLARYSHTAVWSGSEMIVWGGFGSDEEQNTGSKYNPSTDSWTAATTINAPAPRDSHTAVWNGSEMIVWGGKADFQSFFDTGGRYNPITNSWTATNIINAPTARYWHTAVWTGSEMIVWGGIDAMSFLNTGGRYNPNADSWTATTTTNAPVGRDGHTAVWTGNEMMVWGGFGLPEGQLNSGGRYNPVADSWVAIASSAKQRDSHTAVWTGSEMIVWGGIDNFSYNQDTGGRYNPTLDNWVDTSKTNAPSPRRVHSAVWTGSDMIIWGGIQDSNTLFNTGGRYDPANDSWTNTSTEQRPPGTV